MACPRKDELSDLIGLFNIWFLWQKTLNHYSTKKPLLSLFMFFCGLHGNSLNIFQHVVYFSSAFWDHTGRCCKPINRDHLGKKYFMLQVKVGNVSACTIFGRDTEGKCIKWKKNVSENQDKGSLVQLPAKGELQVISCNVFLLILSYKTGLMTAAGLPVGTENTPPSRAGSGVPGCQGSYVRSRDRSVSQHWLHSCKERHQFQPW